MLELLIAPIKFGMCYAQFETMLLEEMRGENAIHDAPLVNVTDHHSDCHSNHSHGKYSSGGGDDDGEDAVGSSDHGGPGSVEDQYNFMYHANFYNSTPTATPTTGDSDAHSIGGGGNYDHQLDHNHHHHSSSNNNAHYTLSAPGPWFSPAVELDTESDDREVIALKGEIELLQSKLDQAFRDNVSENEEISRKIFVNNSHFLGVALGRRRAATSRV